LHVMATKKHTPFHGVANLELLIERYPEALFLADNDGNLPLHTACKSCQSIYVVQKLVEAAPITVHSVSKKGIIPLLVATEYYEDSLDVIFYLVERSPELFLR
jgi:ankyrin repeat protein